MKEDMEDEAEANLKIPSNTIMTPKYETEIRLVGQQSTIREIIILLAYIRDLVDNQEEGDIHVSVGKNIKTQWLGLTVNNMEIPEIRAKATAVVN